MLPQLEGPDATPTFAAKALRSLLSALLLAAAFFVFFMLGSAKPPEQASRSGGPPVVECVRAIPYAGDINFSVDGVVQPYRDLDVAAESGGRVVYKSNNCQTGSFVKQSEVLIKIDDRDYQFELERLGAELEQTRVSVDELLVQIENAKEQIKLAEQTVELNLKELSRIESITTPGAVTESEIDTIRRDIVNSKISLQSQNDQRRSLEASLPRLRSVIKRTETERQVAQLALERCTLRSPIDGIITEEHVEQDGYLQQGALVFTVRDTSRLDVRCSLKTNQLADLRNSNQNQERLTNGFPETPVTVIYSIGNEKYAWEGTLARFDGAGIDAQTRMVPCLVHVDDPTEAKRYDPSGTNSQGANQRSAPNLLVGMFVEVLIHLQPSEELLEVPVMALHPGNRLWVVDQDQLVSRKVRIADSLNDKLLVYADRDGINPNDRIVVSPLASPKEGKLVEPILLPKETT